MIISTKKGTPKEELEKIVDKFEHQGLDVTLITGKDYNVFGLVGDTTKIDERDVLANPWRLWMKFLILNGPNVNLQRYSEPGLPGELDYNGMMDYVQSGCDQMGIETDVCQTNHEGDLIDEIQAAAGRVDGIVLNPGGYAHTSVAILDALRLCGVPAVEVLLTAPDEREPFRKTDVVSFGCQGHFIGQGPQGYLHACAYLAQLLRLDGTPQAHIVM